MKNILVIIIMLLTLQACKMQQSEKKLTASPELPLDTEPAECPYLTKDTKGKPVISWVRFNADSSLSFCFATSKEGGFSSPVVIPIARNIQPHSENLPKIIFKPSGEIIALWGAANPNPKNKYSGLVYYTQSFDEGKSWTDARPLVTDTASFDQRYYDVALLPDGEVGIIWLDNRKTTSKQGSGLYFAATNGKSGFKSERLISQPCCQCCRTDLYVDPKGGIHALFRGIVQDSIRDMVHIVSTDGGKSFSEPKRISEDNWVINGCPHTGPAMTGNDGAIHFAWYTGGKNKGSYYTSSTDNGKTFINHDSVSTMGSHPQITNMPGGDLLITWDETVSMGDKTFKKIGLQRRDASGKSTFKTYITGADGNNSYPVISPLNNDSALVAYTTKKGKKNYIAYRLIQL